MASVAEDSGDTPTPTPVTDVQRRRPRDILADLLPQRPGYGETGRRVELIVNSFPLSLNLKQIHLYDVVFVPDIPSDSKILRKTIVSRCIDDLRALYGTHFYDNTRIWAVKRVEGINDFHCDKGQINVRYLKSMNLDEISLEEQEMVVHIILSKSIRKSNLARVGRNYFEQQQTTDDTFMLRERGFPEIKLWRGYSVSVEPTLSGLQLKADVYSRVLQERTVRDMMDEIEKDVRRKMGNQSRENQQREIKERVMAELTGSAVLTMYNRKVWRIHDVDYSIGVTDTFQKDDTGDYISYQQYFHENYQSKCVSEKAGMLVHIPKKKGRGDQDRRIILAPELCFLTGLTKKMKANYRFMRQMADKTRLGASKRYEAGQKLVKRLEQTINDTNRQMVAEALGKEPDEIKLEGVNPEELDMPLTLHAEQEPLTGRVLEPLRVTMARADKSGEFEKYETDALRGLKLEWGKCAFVNSDIQSLGRWVVLYEDPHYRDMLLSEITRLAISWGLWEREIRAPKIVQVEDFRSKRVPHHRVWEDALQSHLKKKKDTAMVVCILPDATASGAIYSGIKDLCCNKYSVLSQCVQTKTLDPKRLSAVCTNILKQMMTKSGNIPWRIKASMPDDSLDLKKMTMVVGIDVNHDLQRAQSTVGFCASYDKNFTRYHSYVSTQQRGKEIVEEAGPLMYKAMKDFYATWDRIPDQIVVFRDGVSNSQLEAVVRQEVGSMRAAFDRMKKKPEYNPKGRVPKLTFVVVQKRVSARFLQKRGLLSVEAGTVVDSGVVSSRFWDFYLVTCEAPKQGTATSTRYIVVADDIKVSQDAIQTFSHRLCSLYFNWPGPVRSPAPCKYASTLAYLYGTSMDDKKPSSKLNDRLFFL